MNTKSCFVISPIGPDESDVRKRADDVFDLLIEPALEPFGYSITRADKIAGSGQISQEIIDLVQKADLCIVDLTGHNPNVFYECGRRHENGKPFIQIMNKGERIPFDLSGIRTVFYDLSDARSTRQSALRIQEFVKALETSGLAVAGSGVSLSSISETLGRIERKLESGILPSSVLSASPVPGGFAGFQNPKQAFQEAFLRGDIATVVSLLPRMKKILGPANEGFLAAAKALAFAGEESGLDSLIEAVEAHSSEMDEDTLKSALNGISQFYVSVDREKEGLSRIGELFQKFLDDDSYSLSFRGHAANQLQILHHGAEEHVQALECAKKAISLEPAEPSYQFNLSIVYEKLNMLKESEDAIEECMRLGREAGMVDADHLFQAWDIYRQRKSTTKMNDAFQRLSAVDPARAAFAATRAKQGG